MNKLDLRRILSNMRASVPEEIKKELTEQYGSYVIDDEGREFPYTEQDVYEQMRKKLRRF